jgi:uncharacterized protein (DUF58 family)
MSSGPNNSLLDASFLRKLEQLQLVARRVLKGQQHGERRSLARGHSVEFADFRNYSIGDDLRYLDWSLYARLERLFLKLYEEEQELRVTLLLDVSESMGFGSPSKLDAACRIAAALGYIALANFDAVGGVALNENPSSLRSLRNRKSSARLFNFLNGLRATGNANLNENLRKHAQLVQRGGLAILFSDLLEPEGFEKGLTALQSRNCDIFVFHILTPEERHPDFGGDFRMIDSENGSTVEISFPKIRLAAYEKTVNAWCDSIRSICQKRGILYLPITSNMQFEDVVLKSLRAVGAVK